MIKDMEGGEAEGTQLHFLQDIFLLVIVSHYLQTISSQIVAFVW